MKRLPAGVNECDNAPFHGAKSNAAFDWFRTGELLLITMEELTNIARRANSKPVSFGFAQRDGLLRLVVKDDGKEITDDEVQIGARLESAQLRLMRNLSSVDQKINAWLSLLRCENGQEQDVLEVWPGMNSTKSIGLPA